MRKSTKTRLPLELISVVCLLAIWWLLTATIIRPLVFPSPWSVLQVVLDRPLMVLEYSLSTSARVLIGFAIGCAFGIANGITLHMNPTLGRLSDPIVEILRPIPPIALMPFIIIWFGIGDLGKIFLVAAGCSMVLLVSTVEAIRHVSPLYIQAARTLGASKSRIYRTVVMPAIVPGVLSGLRVALALSFTLAIAAEFMGTQSGLGFMIMQARRYLDTATIVAGILIIGLLSLVLDKLLRMAGGYLLRWAPQTQSW